MKHYCNRRTPVRVIENNSSANENIKNPEKINKEDTKMNNQNKEDEIVLPPGSDHSIFEELGKKVITYGEREYLDYTDAQGGLVTQCSGLENTEDCYFMMQNEQRPLYADNLSGSFDVMSVPTSDLPVKSMADYLRKYKGKFLCFDLWTADMSRMEKCGVLLETGDDFVVIQTENRGEIMMIDLKTIRYISIYCR